MLFVYNIGREASCTAVSRLLAASQGRFYLNLKVFEGYRDCPDQPDSWHQYVPADSYDQQGTDSATVSPGFFKFDEPVPRLPRDLERFRSGLASPGSSGARWQLVTSFNEWGEGTAVEPSRQWQSRQGMVPTWTQCGRVFLRHADAGYPLMALGVPAIEDLTVRSFQELPGVRLLGQLQAQHPVASGNPDGASRLRVVESVVAGPTGADDELGHALSSRPRRRHSWARTVRSRGHAR